jgi:hypothetical protein
MIFYGEASFFQKPNCVNGIADPANEGLLEAVRRTH